MADVEKTDPIQGPILHEYDGIEEADNALPTWWLITFYGAIVFAVGYWFVYHELGAAPTPSEQYVAEMAARAASGGLADAETLALLAQDPDTVRRGHETFASTCAACHGDRAQGQIGPNLTDDAWLHGGGPEAIYRSVREGIPPERAELAGSAGMPAWGPPLGEGPVQAVTAYLISIRGANVPGRDPEGEPYDPSADEGGEPPGVDEVAPGVEAPPAGAALDAPAGAANARAAEPTGA